MLFFCFIFQLIHIAGVVVLTQMLLHPELYEERYFETYGTTPRSGMLESTTFTYFWIWQLV